MKLLFAIAVVLLPLLLAYVHSRRGKRRGPRFDVAFLAARLGLEETTLRRMEPIYREQRIDKRGPYRGHGAREQRVLHIPDAETMEIQRRILHRLLVDLRVHPAVMGFEQGSSVAKNAAAHAHQAVVLKMDLVSFFQATRADRVRAYFGRIGWTTEAAEILTRLTTHEGGLPQGAPTSPALSNRLNFKLDMVLASRAAQYRGTYTRYADDITVSFPMDYPKHVRGMVHSIRTVAKSHGYLVHEKRKLRILRRHHSQRVTGLVVNEGPRLPRKTRRWLRAVEHRLATGGEATLTEEQLQGWKAYAAHVDRVREETEAAQRARITEALEANHHSLRGAARRLNLPPTVLKRRMKTLGLWDASRRKQR